MANGGRAASAFLNYRRLQLQEIGLDRQNRLAKQKADEEAAEKLADEKAATRLTAIRAQLNNIRSQAGIYETDELGNTVIREDIFNERLAPLLEEAAAIRSKSHDGADWADFYYKVNIAHRLPEKKKPASASSISDLDAHVAAALEAEAFQVGHELSPIEKETVRKRATREYTELTDKSEGRTPKSLEQRTLDYAEKLFKDKAEYQKGYTPENALAEAQQFYGAAKSFLKNPDVPIVPPAATKKPKEKPEEEGWGIGAFFKSIQKVFAPTPGLFGGAAKPKQPVAEPDTVAVDINDPSLMEDRSDINEREIDVNAKAVDETDAEFEFFEEAEDYYKNRFAQSADSLQKALSAAGRLLPKRKKK